MAGIENAYNRALAEATGEYVAFLDVDDFFFDTYLERTVAFFERSNADMVATNGKLVDDNGRITGEFEPYVHSIEAVPAVLMR